ncbi:hypothetical protein EVAR_64736_1 [Eumeta japonica]|uniref:Uncharacterized protein n=1 Tax=Eumeta variegata TaxID=151549 RepID=A0A4C1Z5U0_EUMVA|nr:hypothetical protein EVAR_64736_1 [Eumeta japonica]
MSVRTRTAGGSEFAAHVSQIAAFWRGKQVCESPKNWWSSPPMDTNNSRGVTSCLAVYRAGIQNQTQGGLMVEKWGDGDGSGSPKRTKSNNGSCLFASILCESRAFYLLSGPIFVLQPNRRLYQWY